MPCSSGGRSAVSTSKGTRSRSASTTAACTCTAAVPLVVSTTAGRPEARPSPTAAISPLTPVDIRDVVEFLIKIEGRAANESAAGRGAAIFLDRGGCFDCHGADAKGDPAVGAPDLTDAIRLTGDGSREALFSAIARGSAGMCPRLGRYSRRRYPARHRGLCLQPVTRSSAKVIFHVVLF